ncbi:MAG: hypothetical protein ACE5HC_07060 [Candidatus Binatia bacterium]
MSSWMKTSSLGITLIVIALLFSHPLYANDLEENAGIGVGLTAGNWIFVPVKSTTFILGLTEGVLSFVLSGGNTELTRQIWENTTDGPYFITPHVAQMAVGERPELSLPDD